MAAAKDQPPPPLSCIICTLVPEHEHDLIQPCRSCKSCYCRECLKEMFTSAVTDGARMPPRCCTLLQIHTTISDLTDNEANDYRAKFEEWSTTNKTYCPSAPCSAFIPERLLPPANVSETVPTLQGVLGGVVRGVSRSDLARFFRGELDVTKQPGYTAVVDRHVDLNIITEHLEAGRYRSAAELTRDMELIVSNATVYNGPSHPVTRTANQLFALYLTRLSLAVDQLISYHGNGRSGGLFTCPKCHVGICSRCKQIEHGTTACDTSAADHEIAMLQTFGYKRCPLCKHAVKKMFGCSHMQCICGAHWCYYCAKSINECEGDCTERLEQDSEYEDDEMDEVDDDIGGGGLPAGTAQPQGAASNSSIPAANGTDTTFAVGTPVNAAAQAVAAAPMDLDAGGARRWAETDLDFGYEPEGPEYIQVWSCEHTFEPYKLPDKACNHGDVNRMECNRCFGRVTAKAHTHQAPRSVPKKRRRFGVLSTAPTKEVRERIPVERPEEEYDDMQALECKWCRLVVCPGCRNKVRVADSQ